MMLNEPFLESKNNKFGGDLIYFQGHSAPECMLGLSRRQINSKIIRWIPTEVSKGSIFLSSSFADAVLAIPNCFDGLGPDHGNISSSIFKYLINRGLVKDEGRKIWV